MAKKRVVVLYGGRADEHSISCISTAGVLGAMDTERFEPIPVGITKDGKWIINGEDPRGWNLDGGELPTVKITPESPPVMLDPSRGQDGFFIAGDGMYVWDPKDVAYKEIKLEVDKVFTSEIFREVTPSGGRIAIDFLKAPYAKVALGQDTLIYNLEIQNTREGSCGKVMVYQSASGRSC